MPDKIVSQEDLFQAIENREPGDYKTNCLNPDHADSIPSMTITVTTDNIYIRTCFGGMADCVGKAQGFLKDQGLWFEREKGRVEERLPKGKEHYIYETAKGEPFAAKVVGRKVTRVGEEKDPRWWKKVKGGWMPGGVKKPYPLYNTPAIAKEGKRKSKTKPICYFVEGEKCCARCVEAFPGRTVFTTFGGTGDVFSVDYKPIYGWRVGLISDGDEPGRNAMITLAHHLAAHGSDVKLILTPGDDGNDIADWLEKLGPEETRMKIKDSWVVFDPEEHTAKEMLFDDKGRKELKLALKNEGIEIRGNTRAHRVEYKKGDGPWQETDDGFVAVWRENIRLTYQYIQSDGKSASLHYSKAAMEEHLVALGALNEVDPFITWLENLPEWDDIPRLPGWTEQDFDDKDSSTYLEDMFNCERNALHRWCARNIILLPIWRAYEPGYRCKQIPILCAPQSFGKSPLLSELLPEEHRRQWFSDGLNFLTDNKTRVEVIQGKVIVELAELTGMKRVEQGQLKAFLSRQDDQCRLSYRRNPQEMPRKVGIVGTTDNVNRPLPDDPAGLTRYVVCRLLESCNVEESMAKHRLQIWSEGMALYRKGITPDFPRDLYDEQGQQAEQYRDRDTVEDDVETFVSEVAHDVRFSLKEIAEKVGMDKNNFVGMKKFPDMLRRYGMVQVKTKAGRWWKYPKTAGD